MRRSAWTKIPGTKREPGAAGGLLLLALILLLPSMLRTDGGESGAGLAREAVFVGVTGDVAAPGVYGFPAPPSLPLLLERAGGTVKPAFIPVSDDKVVYPTGTMIRVLVKGDGVWVLRESMSAHNKMTLGIPLHLNDESAEGLTALPGVGPRLASRIIERRARQGGFRRLRELLRVPGVGPALYAKIKPFLVL